MNFECYLESQNKALHAIDRNKLDAFIDGLREVRKNSGFLWVAGNGGACSTASHTAGDFNKTTLSFGREPVKTIPITDMSALTTAFSNDVDFGESISGPLEILAGPRDALLLLSVSGTSENIVQGLETARNKGMTIFSIVGANGETTAERSTHAIVIESTDYQIVENVQMTLIHWITKIV